MVVARFSMVETAKNGDMSEGGGRGLVEAEAAKLAASL